MGMNGGLHDVFNLCPKIAAIIRDGADDGLLDLYERQRREVTVEFIQSQTDQNRKNIGEITEADRLRRIGELNAMIAEKDRAIAFLKRNNMFDALARSLEIE